MALRPARPEPPWSARTVAAGWAGIQVKCAVYERWAEAGYVSLALACRLVAEDLQTAGFVADAACVMDGQRCGDQHPLSLLVQHPRPSAVVLGPGSGAEDFAGSNGAHYSWHRQ